jgi:hypothetical protein
MSRELGIIIGVSGALLVFASAVAWLLLRARELRRVRGYVVVPPPGRHSTSRRHVGASAAAPHRSTSPEPARSEPARPGPAPAQPEAAPRPRPQSGPKRPDARTAPPRHLVAPVELWFGTTCVGVTRGSDTHQKFDEYASELLAELSDPLPPGARRPPTRLRRRLGASLGASSGYARSVRGR